MKKIAIALFATVLVIFMSGPAFAAAAGSCTSGLIYDAGKSNVKTYKFEWTSSSGGAVQEVGAIRVSGIVLGVEFVAGAGSFLPTDLYDVTLLNEQGADILNGAGADVPVAGSAQARFRTPRNVDKGSIILREHVITPAISAAGNAKTGVIYLYVW